MDHATRHTSSSASSTRVVDVLVPLALNQTYSYRVPREMELKPGDVVCVPLGPREVVAVVWAENANPDPRLHNRLKDVGEKLDVPPLRPGRSCAAWSTGSPITRCPPAAWCCGWPCGWAKT
jgi:primosomal protein N' (replication factor Y)